MVAKNGWENVELVQDDVTNLKREFNFKFDAGVCTLGLSIIPDFKSAYQNLVYNVKEDGELIIGDMKLASGWQSHLNPFILLLSKKYGGSFSGHQNSLEIIAQMNKELLDLNYREFFLGAYYFCVGRKVIRNK